MSLGTICPPKLIRSIVSQLTVLLAERRCELYLIYDRLFQRYAFLHSFDWRGLKLAALTCLLFEHGFLYALQRTRCCHLLEADWTAVNGYR